MQDACIEWAFLQPPLGSGPPEDDVVALVRPDHRAAFGSVARAAGLVTVPAAGHPLSWLYLGLDRTAGRFLRLSVTDRIAFGRDGEFPTTFVAGGPPGPAWAPPRPLSSPPAAPFPLPLQHPLGGGGGGGGPPALLPRGGP